MSVTTGVETKPRGDTESGIDDAGGPGGIRIRCPKCSWSPRAEDRWHCNCGHTWNTFDTGGVCPGCLFQWTVTQCLRCAEISPHSDWYASE